MSIEENKAFTHRVSEEIFNQGNLDLVDEIFDKDFIGHGSPEDIKGPESFKQYLSSIFSAFPDIKVTIQDQIAEGNKVVNRQIATDTHKGEFAGIAPTGKQVTINETIINRIAGGKIVEGWSNIDMLGLMQQIGAVPLPK